MAQYPRTERPCETVTASWFIAHGAHDTKAGGSVGRIEAGTRKTLAALGITDPGTAPEELALELARRLDAGADEKVLAALSRELRLTLEACAEQPEPEDDPVGRLARALEDGQESANT